MFLSQNVIHFGFFLAINILKAQTKLPLILQGEILVVALDWISCDLSTYYSFGIGKY